jgi:hypothetical protein
MDVTYKGWGEVKLHSLLQTPGNVNISSSIRSTVCPMYNKGTSGHVKLYTPL